ncbi:MAG: DUF1553 domain-containing protein [Planctomycetaceae bacterium]
MNWRILPAVLAAVQIAATCACANGVEFFEKKVRPILVKRCFDCHAGDSVESKLHLDSRGGMLRGGLRGAAIVPGKPEKSLLILAIRHNEELKMPAKSKLPAAERKILTEWVKRGAVWPNSKPVAPPTKTKTKNGPLFTAEERAFWAFQRPRRPAVPPVRNSAWARSPIDNFVLRELEQAGLSPAPAAGKRTLIRRVTFDLIGLPPTPAAVAAFLADDSPDAFAKVVDRLLASPQYGERWGRHWLDVARYADSNGLDENLSYANAWRYRDYVVAAFNGDKPYDRFVREQLAGDLMPPAKGGDASEGLVATGFLTLGPKMLAEDDPRKMQMDIIDEQIDTLGKAFLGLWLGCARCHDHKFDPIRTADYYALAGIFKSTKTMENFKVVARWNERPLATPDALKRQKQFDRRIAAAKRRIEQLATQSTQTVLSEARKHAGLYLRAALRRRRLDALLKTVKPIGNAASKPVPGAIIVEAERFARGNVLKDTTNYGKGIGVILNKGPLPNVAEYDVSVKTAGHYQLELRYAAAAARPMMLFVNGVLVKSDAAGNATGSWHPDKQTWEIQGFFRLKAGKNTIRLERAGPFPHVDKLLIAPLTPAQRKRLGNDSVRPGDGYRPQPVFVRQWADYLERTQTDPQLLLAAWRRHLARGKPRKPNAKTPADPKLAAFRKLLDDPKGPFAVSKGIESAFPAKTIAALKRQRAELAALAKTKPKLPVAMAVSEGTPEDLRVHIRGSYLTLGEKVPRRFPRIIAGDTQPGIPGKQSGRLQLANWLADTSNPLTSRVMVNRLWRWHFGAGLVRTPDNFGRLGERPTNQPLLDWLAVEFVRRRWSIKAMHRVILLSSAYQMSTAYNAKAAKGDPQNRLLWRMDRRRLDAEALRDAILAVSGRLDGRMGGSILAVKNRAYVTSTGSNLNPKTFRNDRRSVYLPVIRSALYDVFQTFDFAEPSVANGNRVATTVAPQALLLMNSRLMTEHSRALAGRLLRQTQLSDRQRIGRLFALVYSRRPTKTEVGRLLSFLSNYERQAKNKETKPDVARQNAWQALCRVLLASHEFVYVE